MSLIIRGVIDGPLSGGVPKAIELFALEDIADLSIYGLESANNGNPASAPEFTLSGGATMGDSFFVASEETGFQNFFGFGPDFTSGVASINGDDAIALYENGVIVDVFGVIGVDGTGEPWEHLDGWATRISGGPSETFDLAEWTFSGINALDGAMTNAAAATPYPFDSYMPSPAPASIVITEVMQNPSAVSDFSGEWFEVFNPGPADVDLAGWTIADQDIDSHVIAGSLIVPAGGYRVLGRNAESSVNGGVPVDYAYDSDLALANGADELILTTPEGVEVDRIEWDGGPDWPDPTGASMALTDPAADNNDGANWEEATESYGDGDFGTPGAANGGGGVDPVDPPAEITRIHDIQGDGAAPPLIGQRSTVQAVVTANFLDTLGGFFLQEEDADADDNLATSEGVFVFAGDASIDLDFDALIDVGDLVTLTGSVSEFFDKTQISAISAIEVGDPVAELPSAAEITFPVAVVEDEDGALLADLEAFEGMRVTFPQELTVGDVFNLGRFGEIDLNALGRLPAFTQTNAPDVDGFDAFKREAAANAILLDDGSGAQNPDFIPFEIAGQPGAVAGQLDAEDELGSGDTVTGLTGVLDFGFSQYRVQPTASEDYGIGLPEFVNATPRAATPPEVGGELTVTAFNVLNYFTTLDQDGNTTGPDAQQPRGADNLPEFERQTAKIVAALTEIEADILGLIEIENEFIDINGDGLTAIQFLADALNAAIDGVTYEVAAPEGAFVGDDVIAVALLYNAATVSIADGTTVEVLTDADLAELGADPGNPVFDGNGTSRSPIAATFVDNVTGDEVTVAVNHFKSKGSAAPFGDNADKGDGAAASNEARTQAAEALVAWLENNPTGATDTDRMIVGDLNAYAQEDPIRVLREAGYTDLAALFSEEPFDYSYGFPVDLADVGQAQNFGQLDYALASESLLPKVTGAAEWLINADEPRALDYNDFNQPQLFASTPFRSSDHDPVIVGLNPKKSLELVSSGDVTEDSAVLLARSRTAGDVTFDVYQVGSDGGRTLVATRTVANGGADVPSKVAVDGLEDGANYVYVVTDAAGSTSEGRFRTARADGQNGLTFGVTGDWRGELSPYPAIANADDADLDVFLLGGDTIYADYESPGLPGVPQAATLDDYRAKYQEVYGERGGANFFAELLASTSIYATIDDHEVTNDFAGGGLIGTTAESEFRDLFPGDDPTAFVNDSTLYENGLQAWQEHHAIAEEFYGSTGDARTEGERKLYRSQAFGDDAAIMVLDQRSFRDEQIDAVSDPTDLAQIAAFEAASFDPDRTLLGEAQLAELKADLLEAQADGVTWKFIYTPEPFQDLGLRNSDSWEGYKAERTEILKVIDDKDISNVVFVAADIHATLVNNITYSETPFGEQIATGAFEITTGSVAFDAPFGPSVVSVAADLGLIDDPTLALYDSLPIAPDDTIPVIPGLGPVPNDKDDVIRSAFNDLTLTPAGLDPLGLDDNLPQADGLIDATLTQGGWVSAHTYGWTEFDIDAHTQALTVTTYGIDAYSEADVVADPETVAMATPRIVSQFTVNPEIEPVNFTLELLHFTDQEANAATIDNIDNLSAVLNALRDEDLFGDGLADNTLTLSSGDAIIPGLFFDASEAVFGSAGIADIQIQNELGVQAIAFGNHEFDFGTAFVADLIDGSAPGDFSALTDTSLDGQDFTGAAFPYLSANLDFSTDPNLAPLAVAGGQDAGTLENVVTSSAYTDVNGERIGIVGATTPTIGSISSPGDDLGIDPTPFDSIPTPEQLDALAAEIQAEVDTLLDDNPGMNKVVLLAHMQRIDIELELAGRLADVDIIVAGGSNTRLFDDNDRPRDGDSDQGQYPQFVTNAGGTTTAVVNTDGSYKYVGRLVIDFDENGHILAESYDETISGAYATDDQGVEELDAEGLIDPEIDAITDAIQDRIVATESNVFGVSDVFLNGNRSGTGTADDPDGVRTQETNLGNLTADANLAYANQMIAANGLGEPVLVSIKNGGGIRANIGQVIVPPGGTEAERLPNEEIIDEFGDVVKPEGGISQNDIGTTLAFNNGLAVVDVTRAELVNTLEGGVSALPGVDGGFPQIAGVRFAFDETRPAGDRLQNAVLVDRDDNVLDVLVFNGEFVGDPNGVVRTVTLNFLLDFGDPILSQLNTLSNPNRIDLDDLDGDGTEDGVASGAATFSDDGTEQDALAEYLNDNFDPANDGVAFSDADTGPEGDTRIQNLAFREDGALDGVTMVEGTDGRDRLTGTDGVDIVNAKGGRLDRVEGGDSGDVFHFDLETLTNSERGRVFVNDYNPLEGDSLFFETEIADMRFSGRQAIITLEGDGDRVYVRGEFDSLDDLLIFAPDPADVAVA